LFFAVEEDLNRSVEILIMRLLDACTDDADVLALSVLRSLVAGYTTGDIACWEMAHVGAERVIGSEAAAMLVASLMALVRTIRIHGREDCCFLPVTCCRVTGDERTVLAILAAARRDGGQHASLSKADLVRKDGEAALEAAVRTAARVLNEIGSRDLTTSPPGVRAALH
jgi:hypothetical protein